MTAPRFAFIDIGTNTILCLIAELRDGGRFRVLNDLAEIARLGEGVDATGAINPQSEQRSARVLRGYLETCKALGVAEIIAVGTSALRDARNGGAVLERWRAQLGFPVRLISGEEEAGYSFLAVRKGLSVDAQELLVVDIGGGSTELIRGNRLGILGAISVDIGTVRLTERFIRSDPVSVADYNAMVAAIDNELEKLRQRWPQVAAAAAWVGIAGTYTTLAAVQLRLAPYSHSAVHGWQLTQAEVQRQIRLYQSKTIAERKTIKGLEPKRADVILAGACLIERMMRLYGCAEVIVSDEGVRYGLLYERLERM